MRWAEPVRSPGSLPQLERALLTVRFPTQALSQVQQQAATAHFSRLTQNNDMLIADEAICADVSAPALELSSPQAV